MNIKRVDVVLPDKRYAIEIGAGALQSTTLNPLIETTRVLVVTEPNVARHHLQTVVQRFGSTATETLVVPMSEATKAWPIVESIISHLLQNRFDRKSVLVALGGGVVGDVVGFAAAIYQRGIRFIQMPTTLLSMVDSSVGGKTGVNHSLGKNMIGAFHQPELVISDLNFLATLPSREISAGLAEIIKHGAIIDPAYLQQIQQNMQALRNLDSSLLAEVVARSCEIKAHVVSKDEKEQGLRAILNFGHTFGHAIEAGLGYGEWLHGEAVGAGMVMASHLSESLGLLSQPERARLQATILAAGLPIHGPAWTPERYLELMATDKKAADGAPKFVLLQGLGHAVVRHVPDAALKATLSACAA